MFNKRYNKRDAQLVGHCFFSKTTETAEFSNYTQYYDKIKTDRK